MSKTLTVLTFAAALAVTSLAASAQNGGHKTGHSKRDVGTQSHAARDVTASLQAQAIAEAAARVTTTATSPAETAKTAGMPKTGTTLNAPKIEKTAPISAPLPVLSAVPAVQDRTAKNPVPAQTDLGHEELAIADRIHQGVLPCELGASVRVEIDSVQPGYFHVTGKGFRYRMHPVRTQTGTLRLEDKKAGAVWLQLANKSMLMDQKKGRRLVDDCAHPDQMAYAESMKTNPPPRLIDMTGTGR